MMDTTSIRAVRWPWSAMVGAFVFFVGCAPSSREAVIARQAREVAARRLAQAQYPTTPLTGETAANRPNPSPTFSEVTFTHWVADTGRQQRTVSQDNDSANGEVSELSGGKRRQQETPTSEASTIGAVDRGPLPGFRDTVKRDVKESPGLLWKDTKAVFLNPWNVVFLVGAGGASLALRPEVDDDIEDYYEKHHTFSHDWRDAFGAVGNPGTHFALAGLWYLAGQQFQDAKSYEIGKRLFSALIINGLSTMTLKVMAHTDSPNGEQLAWPSGHVSSTMTLATVLNDAYGPAVGIPMFGLTALVGIERLDDGEHSFSDLIFGAALGWVVAETVMKEHRPEVFGGQIVPYVDPAHGDAGIVWVRPLGNK